MNVDTPEEVLLRVRKDLLKCRSVRLYRNVLRAIRTLRARSGDRTQDKKSEIPSEFIEKIFGKNFQKGAASDGYMAHRCWDILNAFRSFGSKHEAFLSSVKKTLGISHCDFGSSLGFYIEKLHRAGLVQKKSMGKNKPARWSLTADGLEFMERFARPGASG